MRFFNQLSCLFESDPSAPNVCVVATLKEEDPFIDEWLAYHRLLGVDHFYLYDNDPRLPLKTLLQPHADYVTIIDWLVEHDDPLYPGKNKQLKAYNHFLKNFGDQHTWAAFIDADEFITLRQHSGIKSFLREFKQFDAVSLNWHVFGHNGHYRTPDNFVLASLTRRMQPPSANVKTISKIKSIVAIESAHYARVKTGRLRVDANKKEYKDQLYPDKTKVAHINHYHCKSFIHWMKRPARGEVGTFPSVEGQQWRFDEESCLKHFVRIIAKDRNEFVDEYMLKYIPLIKDYLLSLKSNTVSILQYD